ncbi:hypothetical protein ACFWDG_19255 [Peribacillus sp. NPDC060186]
MNEQIRANYLSESAKLRLNASTLYGNSSNQNTWIILSHQAKRLRFDALNHITQIIIPFSFIQVALTYAKHVDYEMIRPYHVFRTSLPFLTWQLIGVFSIGKSHMGPPDYSFLGTKKAPIGFTLLGLRVCENQKYV